MLIIYLLLHLQELSKKAGFKSDSETTLQLVKQGVTVDEIVKLRNNDLI